MHYCGAHHFALDHDEQRYFWVLRVRWQKNISQPRVFMYNHRLTILFFFQVFYEVVNGRAQICKKTPAPAGPSEERGVRGLFQNPPVPPRRFSKGTISLRLVRRGAPKEKCMVFCLGRRRAGRGGFFLCGAGWGIYLAILQLWSRTLENVGHMSKAHRYEYMSGDVFFVLLNIFNVTI